MSLFSSLEATVKAAYAASFSKKKKKGREKDSEKKMRIGELKQVTKKMTERSLNI